MSRLADRDFTLLRQFLVEYGLSELVANQNNMTVVKSAHKAYLPLLQLWSICSDQASNDRFTFFGQNISHDSQQLLHLREAVSDISSGLFCCIQGAYKPGYMSLRSSIENFLRFAAAPFDLRAATTTSIYELFDLSKQTLPFSDNRKIHISQLRSDYTELCKYTHSASLSHMSGVHALAHFPSFDKKAFQGWLMTARSCMSAIAAVISIGSPTTFLNAHYAARELLESLIPQEVRLDLLKGVASNY
jgi:hypothetical protein